MLTLQQIRDDLKDIRYYYSRKEAFEQGFRVVGSNDIVGKAKRYNTVMQSAPTRLYDIYVGLYARNLTQEALSVDNAVKNYVDSNIERKRRNLIMRRIRLTRKVNLQTFNYFVTFTFNGKLHPEESFRKSLKKTLANFTSRKGWKYVGVWERSPEKQRLHFHGLFYIPEGATADRSRCRTPISMNGSGGPISRR